MAVKQTVSRVRIDMLFDIISPYAYIQLELLHRNHKNWPKMNLQLKPFFLPSIFFLSKNVAPIGDSTKAHYLLDDLKRLSKTYQIPLHMPDDFVKKARSKSSLSVQRFLTAIQSHLESEQFQTLVRHIYRKHFSPESIDLTDLNIILQLTIESGIDLKTAQNAIESINKTETKNILKNFTQEAVKMGVFGAPTIFIYTDNEKPKMIWGSDRLFVVGQLIGESSPPILLKQ